MLPFFLKYPLVATLTITFTFTHIQAQKVIVTETEEKIEEMKRKGLSAIIELDEEGLRKNWIKKLKEYGTLKTKGSAIIVEQANLPALSQTPVKIISTVQTTPKGTKIWWAIDLGDAYVTADGDKNKYDAASKILKDFGIAQYIDDINQQIKEAERVLSQSVREQEKLIQKGDNINSSIEKNRNEKIKLIQKIAETDSSYKKLKGDSLQNVLNLKAAAENVDKMKRAVEIVKDKIKQLE